MGKGTQRLKNIFTDNTDEINQGYTINSWHVSQSVEAFTGTGSFDIEVEGSITVTGSIYHESATDAAGALSNVVVRNNSTGEYFITGSYGGADGSSGSSGSSGTSGAAGSSGSSGTSGTGSDGSSGSSGTSGTGSDGSSGSSGTSGSSGSSGTSGGTGSAGSSGSSGTSGSSGGTQFTRPGSDTSITYDTYLNTTGYAIDEVATSPTAPNANGNMSIRYAVSNIGSNVDRIDVYKTASGGGNNSNTLENLAVSGSIILAVTGVGAHTERYTIVSATDNSTYMSYAVDWVSGDDAAFVDTEPTMTSTFQSDYEYELSTGYNRLLITNNSAGVNQRFRMTEPSSADAGDEVIVELKVNTTGQNVQPAYQLRGGGPSVRSIRNVYEIDGTTISNLVLDTNDVAIMRFQVNDLGSVEGLTLLGANQIIDG